MTDGQAVKQRNDKGKPIRKYVFHEQELNGDETKIKQESYEFEERDGIPKNRKHKSEDVLGDRTHVKLPVVVNRRKFSFGYMLGHQSRNGMVTRHQAKTVHKKWNAEGKSEEYQYKCGPKDFICSKPNAYSLIFYS